MKASFFYVYIQTLEDEHGRVLVVMHHIRMNARRRGCKCVVVGCLKMLTAEILICDPLLIIEIDELCFRGRHSTQAQIVADCPEIDED